MVMITQGYACRLILPDGTYENSQNGKFHVTSILPKLKKRL